MKNWFTHLLILLAFVGHVLTGVVIFCAVGAGALAIHVFRVWLATKGLEDYVLSGLHGLEIVIFICDMLTTGLWTIMSTIRAIKDILKHQEH